MRPADIVEIQIPTDLSPRHADCGISVQINLLVFNRSPQPLDDDVVAPGASTVHADRDLFAHQHGR